MLSEVMMTAVGECESYISTRASRTLFEPATTATTKVSSTHPLDNEAQEEDLPRRRANRIAGTLLGRSSVGGASPT